MLKFTFATKCKRVYDEAEHLVTQFDRQRYCQVYNSCSKCSPFACTHALRCQWCFGPCCVKRPANASSVRWCCNHHL